MTSEKLTLGIPDRLGEGGAFINPTSDPNLNLAQLLRNQAGIDAPVVANLAAIKAIPANSRGDGMQAYNKADGSRWVFSAASAAVADDIFASAPAVGTGRWIRQIGEVDLWLPIAFGTADAAILATVPTGAVFEPWDFAWNVTTPFTGGASSAIGVSSATIAGHTTKGDLLGGAAGDVAAALTAGWKRGTIGAQWGTIALRRALMVATDNLRFDRITSAFTAGAGFVVASGFLHTPAT